MPEIEGDERQIGNEDEKVEEAPREVVHERVVDAAVHELINYVDEFARVADPGNSGRLC